MDRDTVINPFDEDDSDEDLMVNLHKDRRSGVERRVGPSSNSLARLDIEREYRAEIRALQERENQKDVEISELKVELAKVQQWQKDNEGILNGAEKIVNAGTVVKWLSIFVLAFLAIIGGIFTVMDGIKKWFP
jgi:hypothetical protein